MSRVQLLTRYVPLKNTYFGISSRRLQKAQLSSSSTNSDDEKKLQKKLDEKKRSKEALDKLNALLKSMTGDDVRSTNAKLNLAKPVTRKQKNVGEEPKQKSTKVKSPGKSSVDTQIATAVKDVAESIGGDVKQTQSELLTKLLNATNGSSTNLMDLVKGMKIDEDSPTKAQQVRQILQARTSDTKLESGRPRAPRKPDLMTEKIDLFGSEPLGIFTEKESYVTEGAENKIWNKLYQRDLKLAVTHPPSNYFQQQILWTEQGKIWKFPIDNEQGLEEEKKIYFTEHVFLEKHLEPWCPAKGPLRHFMELVCVGLSKNPYLTVDAKKEHIQWFKNYFEDKKQLLKETGVIQDQETGNRSSGQKQIE